MLLALSGGGADAGVASTVSVTSDYDFRGISQTAKNPALQARKLEPKTPSHAFCNQDFERCKSGVGSLNPCLEDGFPCLHRC